MTRTAAPDRARQVAAALLTATAVTVLPALLATLVGWPLPSRLPTGQDVTGWVTDPLTSGVVVDVLAVIAWLAWAHFMTCLVVEVINATARRHRPALRVPFGGVSQTVAGRLVTALLLLGASVPMTATPAIASHPTGSMRPVSVAAAGQHNSLDPKHAPITGESESAELRGDALSGIPAASASPETGASTGADVEQEAPLRRYTVAAPRAGYHENLWDIAERHLGDGMRWSQIYQLNAGQPQPDEGSLTDPDLILPGWQLRMPADATDLAPWTSALAEPGHDLLDGRPESSSGEPSPAPHGPSLRVVVPGDTLWDIAEEELGDGARYDQLARPAAHLVQPDGTRLDDPDLIRPGWVISIPSEAGTEAPAAPAQGPDEHEPTPRESTPVPAGPDRDRDRLAPPEREAPRSPAAADRGQSKPSPQALATVETRRTPTLSDITAEQQAQQQEEQEEDARAVAAVAGGGLLLAGGVFAALLAARRRQFRCRRLGRTIAPAPPDLVPVERALIADGPRGVVEGEQLDLALRDLAAKLAGDPDGMPDVIAVRMDPDRLNLRLREPRHTPPSPWTADESGLWWSVPATATFAPTLRTHQLAPCPTLVTVAHRGSSRWMVDLEAAGSIALRGPATRCEDLARFIAAELAVNSWSDHVTVTLVGFGNELVDLCPGRVGVQPDVAAAVADARADLDEHRDLRDRAGADGLAGRVRDVAGDSWLPHVILLGPAAPSEEKRVDELLAQLDSSSGRLAVAAVVTGYDGTAPLGLDLRLDADGGLRIDDLGLSATAEALDVDDATGMAALLAAAREGGDTEMPAASGTAPWTRYATADGSLRPSMTTPRAHPDVCLQPATRRAPAGGRDLDADPGGDTDNSQTCLLPMPDEAYLAAAATTPEDLAALAPNVPAPVRPLVEGADPTLDEDLTAWWAADGCDLPRLTLLGPIRLRAHGRAPAKRTAFYTELVAYLASRPNGATCEQVADAFRLQPNTARTAVNVTRTWLGTNPRTGRKHVPDALQSEAGKARGVGVYQVEDLLVDCDLMRRLRVRGQARGGTEGLADLIQALRLVTGEPFAQMHPGGGTWITDGERIDHHLTAAVVDIAHTVVTAALAAADTGTARAAAETALLAAPHDDIPHLDMAAVRDAAGDKTAAELALQRDVVDRCDDRDAPDRTVTILARRDWLTRTG